MVTSEREMVRKIDTVDPESDHFTSLQPTYEDTVVPDPEEDWEYDE